MPSRRIERSVPLRPLLACALAGLVVAGSRVAQADPAPDPAPPEATSDASVSAPSRLVEVTGGISSTGLYKGCVAADPGEVVFVQGCASPGPLLGSLGGAVGLTAPVATRMQHGWSLRGGAPGLHQLRVGGGVGYERLHTCLFGCSDAAATDVFARLDALLWTGDHVSLVSHLDAGVSLISFDEQDQNDVSVYPYVSLMVGVGLGH